MRASLTYLLVALAGTAVADDLRFSKTESDTTRLVTQLIEARHLEKQPIDDSLSKQFYESYVETWDSNRLYFTESDIKEFNAYKTSLDEYAKSGQLKFATLVFNRFVQRSTLVLDRFIKPAIADPHDFETDESIVKDGSTQDWAVNDEELRARWQKTIKLQLLNLKLDGDDDEDAKTKLNRRYANNLNLLKQTEPSELLEVYLTTFMQCFDPHSRYFSPRSEDDFRMDMSLQMTGIGARLRHDVGDTVVEEIVKGGAADKDGRLQAGDIITAVGQGTNGKLNDIVGSKLQHVVDQIRGAKGTIVRLQVLKNGTNATVVYDLNRQLIELESQQVSGVTINAGDYVPGATATVGVLTIPSFYRDFEKAAGGGNFRSTSRDIRKLLKRFRDEGVDSLIVDIRRNSGGALAEAIEVTGLFIPDGPVVQMQARGEKLEVLADQETDCPWRGPLVVLSDRGAASASEIFAAAIKDYKRGIVVGDETTHGKGSVQNILGVRSRLLNPSIDRGALKLTIGTWHGISGQSNQLEGVKSDVVLPSVEDVQETGERSLDNALPNVSRSPVKYLAFQNYVGPKMLEAIRRNSQQRILKDEDFAKIVARKNYVEQLAAETHVSLNLKQQQQRRKQVEELLSSDSPESESEPEDSTAEFGSDFYTKEVLEITVDYLNLLKKPA